MTLVIAAQDIKGISLGLVKDGKLEKRTDLVGEPDRYLSLVDATLKEWGMTVADVTRLVVVTGPGAFTASRVSVTLANAIAFARRIPLVPVANPAKLSLEQLIVSKEFSSAEPIDGFAIPVYDRPPHITLPKSRGL
jgi:hypothetical protein